MDMQDQVGVDMHTKLVRMERQPLTMLRRMRFVQRCVHL